MMIDCEIRKLLFKAVAQRVIASADELTDLDRAIGDGDHGTNMRRGFEAVLLAVDELSAKNLGESLKGVGTTLVMKVGGASGPLYGTLFMSLGKTLEDEVTREQFADAFADATEERCPVEIRLANLRGENKGTVSGAVRQDGECGVGERQCVFLTVFHTFCADRDLALRQIDTVGEEECSKRLQSS